MQEAAITRSIRGPNDGGLRSGLPGAARGRAPKADGPTVLPTADGYIRALPPSPRQWKAFVELLGVETLANEWTHCCTARQSDGSVCSRVTALRDRPAEVLARARALDVRSCR